jgi:hypothetical protein
VSVGAADGAGIAVRVHPATGWLDVELVRRGAGEPERSEHRAVPTSPSCSAVVETVADIVARAVTPLGDVPIPPPAPRPPPETPPAQPPRIVVLVPAPPRAPPVVQLFAMVRSNLSLQSISPGVGGLFGADARWRNALLFVAGGIEEPIPYRSPSATLLLGRAPLLAGLGYELPIPSGAVRFTVAALVDLWTVSEQGHASSHLYRAGVQLSAAYHLRLTRWLDLFAGIDFDCALQRSTVHSADGTATAVTPSYWLDPRLGAAINFF